ncbi:AMP-binding protein [Blastococcus saxobsidens]|uniref:Acyl-CoA synthetase (AMP-forming)/AMP-acid ligase n=1 Tax=Blastococcus saxobsidens (strain DD2) TaxID=1146883 RepID=H6RPM6_BLASD|nr:AMP-binding protein [Blastococcus saxobsidens]CCG05285.1 Acyl-CoA synthetase (AMP-forming)/AMP-acid ligase [Blastococcus saxobsidens DD2]
MSEAGTSLAALVRAAAGRDPGAPAVVVGDRRLTWGELDAAADRVAAGYAGRGLTHGERVAVQLPNGLDWLRAVLGALRAGLVVVPVNTAYTDPELEHVLVDSGAALLVAASDRDELAGVPVCPGPPEAEGPPVAVADDPEALAFLCYTSGTTGLPRGAMLTSAALRANQEQCLAMTPPPVRPDDRVLLVLPLFHVYGLNAGFGLVAATGACAVLQESFDPRLSLEVMAEEQVTAVPGAPPMYQAWLAAADATTLEDPAHPDAALRRGFAAVRIASAGAAPLPEEVWTAMRERAAVTVWEGYGLTEAAPVVASTLATGRPKPACIGGPVPGLELTLRDTATIGTVPVDLPADADGSAVADHDEDPGDAEEGPGEIWVRGPNLFSGYWPDGADGPGADGWLRTGDLAYRDADGDLHLVDRRSDLILVSGFNVYPAEVERVLDQHPAVVESAVIGVPDPRTGAAVRAVVVLTPGRQLTIDELQEHAAQSLARYKVPSSVYFLPSLPHSLTGKVSRARLRELGLTGADGAAVPVATGGPADG